MHQREALSEATQHTVHLLNTMVSALVDHPEAVRIDSVEGGSSVIFEVRVERDDLKRLIGRHGRTADALRTILTNVAGRNLKNYHLELVEPRREVL